MTTPLNNKKGTTLVELMVCLVLLALFGTAAVTLVKPCAEAYIEVQQLTRAQNLADALTETIRGELADADGTISIVNAATESDADSADADSANNIFIEDARLTEGTALRFTVESSYTEILDAGYVPKLTATTLNADKKLDEGRLQFHQHQGPLRPRRRHLCRAEPLPAHAFLQANGGQGRKEKRVHDLRLYNGLS